jgi:hypothetical protein
MFKKNKIQGLGVRFIGQPSHDLAPIKEEVKKPENKQPFTQKGVKVAENAK